jgi:hypothetical protein
MFQFSKKFSNIGKYSIKIENLFLNLEKFKTKMEETKLSIEIKKFLIENKCELKTDVTFFTTKNSKITYICACGIEKTQMYKDYVRRECRTCREKKADDNDF